MPALQAVLGIPGEFGFLKKNELFVGRVAMLGFAAELVGEVCHNCFIEEMPGVRMIIREPESCCAKLAFWHWLWFVGCARELVTPEDIKCAWALVSRVVCVVSYQLPLQHVTYLAYILCV